MALTTANLAVWIIAGGATAGVIVRPFRGPEAVWAVAGALALVAFGLLPVAAAMDGVVKGTDVYLFLTGMMLLSEIARREGLFDWVAAFAVNRARGSPRRLFLLVYAVGVVVTTFMSNDATAVVLTPAVFAVARRADVEPLPLLYVCALVANAASFVLPISNPANIVLYGGRTPALASWMASFALPSLVSVLVTYGALRLTQAGRLGSTCAARVEQPRLSRGGWTALVGLAATAAALTVVSALHEPLGLPTCVLGLITTAVVLILGREPPWPVVRSVSWSVLPLVAGLFVLVEAVDRTGLTAALASALTDGADASVNLTAAASGLLLGVVCNLMNNLPAGLIASTALAHAHPPQKVVDALLIGVDLGPNLSITGSLATILWLDAIRREGQHVGFWRFLKVGALAMPPALVLAVGVRLLRP